MPKTQFINCGYAATFRIEIDERQVKPIAYIQLLNPSDSDGVFTPAQSAFARLTPEQAKELIDILTPAAAKV